MSDSRINQYEREWGQQSIVFHGRNSLTKSSNPSNLPVNSRSLFMITHIRDPMHLSINSGEKQHALSTRNADEPREENLMARFERPWDGWALIHHKDMTVRLRMSIHGKRNNRIFHLVAIDLRKRRDAKPIEMLGVYRPSLKPGETEKRVEWSVERIKYWLSVGAQPSKHFQRLLNLGGITQPPPSEEQTIPSR